MHPGRSTRTALVAAVAALLAARSYRRWHLAWGARPDEVAGPMPGDGLLDRTEFVATRAITVAAPPSEVWPWLVQVGYGRAGFYSYDLLDNLGRPSARRILPDHQEPRVGDLAAPMASPPDDDGAGGTRLVTRLKARYDIGPFLPATLLLMEVGDFPMMRRMLLGIRERAEAGAGVAVAGVR